MTAVSIPRHYVMTYEDWLALPEQKGLCELIDGVIVLSPYPTIRHQRIVTQLLLALAVHLQTRPGEVLPAPLGVRFSETDVLQPDIVVFDQTRCEVAEHAILGTPDIVVEVLSPGTAKRDLTTKRAIYERGGVGEFWIVDPVGSRITILALVEGKYEEHAVFGFEKGDTLASPSLEGFAAPLAEIFTEG